MSDARADDEAIGDQAIAEAAIDDAVIEFVRRHGDGQPDDLETYCSTCAPALRDEIRARILNFLAFDELLAADDPSALLGHSAPGAAVGVDDAARRRLGEFEILDEIGHGGMGVVYRAVQHGLSRTVALKVLSRGLGLSARYAEMFRREAAAAARLEHPGIVKIHAAGEVDGVAYYAMELVSGRCLHTVLDELRANQPAGARVDAPIRGRLGVLSDRAGYHAEVAELVQQIADALAAAHQVGLIHRDVKTRNIMLDANGRARLLDFGLAKDLALTDDASLTGEVTGTPHAMSPEQTGLREGPVDARTDVFAIGVVLYELLTLRRPFEGADFRALAAQIANDDPPSITKLRPSTPRDLVTICMTALQKDPAQRYAHAGLLRDDLQRFARFEPIHAQPATLGTRMRKALRRHRRVALAAAIVCLLAASWLALSLRDAALRRERAGDALALAAAAQAESGPEGAQQLALEALRWLPDDAATIARVREFQLAAAERNRLLAEAANVRARDPELALLASLEAAERYGADHAVRSAVLSSLDARFVQHDLNGHRAMVNVATFDALGRFVATGSSDHTVRLYDVDALELPPRVLEGHGFWVRALTFSEDGEVLVSGSHDRSVRVWKTADASFAEVLPHGQREVHLLSVDEKGERLITGDREGVLRVWDLRGRKRRILRGHTGELVSLAVLRDGTRTVTVGADRTLRLWDTAIDSARDTELARVDCGSGRPQHVVVDPAERRCAVGTRDGTVSVFALLEDGIGAEKLAEFRHAGSAQVHDLEFAPAGTRARFDDGTGPMLVTASRDGTARLFVLEPEPREFRVLTGHEGDVYRASFSVDGRSVVTAGQDGTARLWDVATGRQTARLDHPDAVYSARLSADGQRLLTRFGETGVRVWEVAGTRPTLALYGARDRVRCVAFTRDGTRLVSSGNDGVVSVHDARDGTLRARFELTDVLGVDAAPTVLALARDPQADDRVLIAAEAEVRTISIADDVADARQRSVVRFAGHGGTVHAAVFDAAGASVATACADGSVRVFRTADGELLATIACDGPVHGVVLSPDGARVVAFEREQLMARVFDVATGEQRGTLGIGQVPISALAHAGGGDRIAVGARDGSIVVYDGSDGSELARWTQHRGGVHALRFVGLDDSMLVSVSSDRTAMLFDLVARRPFVTWSAHGDRVYGCDVDAASGRVATCSADRSVRVWPIDALAVARALPLRGLRYDERAKLQVLREVDHRAQRTCDALFDELVLSADVVERLRQTDAIDADVREIAIEIASARREPEPDVLTARAAALVMSPDASEVSASRALRLAEAACRLDPDNGFHHGHAALAAYRSGDWQACHERFAYARNLLARAKRREPSFHLAFSAMAAHRLGLDAEADAALSELRARIDDATDPNTRTKLQALLAEAEAARSPGVDAPIRQNSSPDTADSPARPRKP